MKKFVFIAISFILLCNYGRSESGESAHISGTIFMPVMAKERRTFRGRMYRNRLSSAKKKKEENKILKSSFIDVIVSARPLSFEIDIAPMEPVKVLQVNAEFIPRVVAVTPGTEVHFINRDNFFHNVFSITPGSRFNIGRKPTGIIVSRKIEKLGATSLFCDIHAQMNATVLCLNTPYFVRVNPNGRYNLSDLPEGTYEIKVHHPNLPEVTEIIEVKAGDNISRSYTLSR